MAHVCQRTNLDGENDTNSGRPLLSDFDCQIPLDKLSCFINLEPVERKTFCAQKASNALKTKRRAALSPHPCRILGFVAILAIATKGTDA